MMVISDFIKEYFFQEQWAEQKQLKDWIGIWGSTLHFFHVQS